jgi:hypothetical protein
MSELFILQNQQKLFLGKQNNWLDGRDLNALYKTPHKDEAINQMVETSSKDYTQRIKVISCAANEKGLPLIDPQILPEPLPKLGKDLLATLEEEAAKAHAANPEPPAVDLEPQAVAPEPETLIAEADAETETLVVEADATPSPAAEQNSP